MLAVASVIAVGTHAVTSSAITPPPCACPMVYAPV